MHRQSSWFRYTERRVIKNNSGQIVILRLFPPNGNTDEFNIMQGDSVIFSANCEVRGGDRGCADPDTGMGVFLASEDFTHIIFNDEKILRYIRENSDSCLDRNILIFGTPCGYTVEGQGTSLRTYTYEITNEDYENAKPIDG